MCVCVCVCESDYLSVYVCVFVCTTCFAYSERIDFSRISSPTLHTSHTLAVFWPVRPSLGSWVTADHEIESESAVCKNGKNM